MRYPKWLGTLCAIGLLFLQATPAQSAPENGWWWNPQQSGRGYSIEIQGSSLFMAGYLYEDDGRATWLVSGGAMQDATTYAGRLLAFSNGQTLTGNYQAPAAPTDAGAVTLQFSDDSHGTLTWPGGAIPIERFRYSNAAAASFQPENGWWWNEAESGRGFFIEIQGDQMFVAGYMYDASGKAVWYVSGGAMTSPTTYQGDWLQFANGQTMMGPYVAPSAPVKAGAVSLNYSAPDQATLTLSDEQQLIDALPPDPKSVPKGVPKMITLKPFLPKKPPPWWPHTWVGDFSITDTLVPTEGVVTDSSVATKGTVTWVLVATPLVSGNVVSYEIFQGQVEVTFLETIDTTDLGGVCPGIATTKGKATKTLKPSDGELTLNSNKSYTGNFFFIVPVPVEVVDSCGTTTKSRDVPVFMFFSGDDVTGDRTNLNMRGNFPNQSLLPGITTSRTWNFNGRF